MPNIVGLAVVYLYRNMHQKSAILHVKWAYGASGEAGAFQPVEDRRG
jgi:hypothetical protein